MAYGAVVSACERGGQWQTALDLFQKATEEGLANVRVLNSAIGACGKAALWAEAQQLFHEALGGQKGSAMAATVVTFNAMISAFDRASRWRQSLSLLQQLLESDIQAMASALTYLNIS